MTTNRALQVQYVITSSYLCNSSLFGRHVDICLARALRLIMNGTLLEQKESSNLKAHSDSYQKHTRAHKIKVRLPFVIKMRGCSSTERQEYSFARAQFDRDRSIHDIHLCRIQVSLRTGISESVETLTRPGQAAFVVGVSSIQVSLMLTYMR